MKIAAAIVTDNGGRTCHAAIVARELGIPAVVGATHATEEAQDRDESSRSPAPRAISAASTRASLPSRSTRTPCERAQAAAHRHHGQSRHPRNGVPDRDAAERWRRPRAHGIHHQRAYRRPSDGAGQAGEGHLGQGTEGDRSAGSQLQEPVRFLHRKAVGRRRHDRRGILSQAGDRAACPTSRPTNTPACSAARRSSQGREPDAGIPRRRALRHPAYAEGFALECAALRRVREEMGLTNLRIMVPFCRRVEEARRVIEAMASHGLKRGENGLEIYVMCEIPNNVIQIDAFSRVVRRLFDRLQRSDPADAGRRPGFRYRRLRFRRARSGHAGDVQAGRDSAPSATGATSASAARRPRIIRRSRAT